MFAYQQLNTRSSRSAFWQFLFTSAKGCTIFAGWQHQPRLPASRGWRLCHWRPFFAIPSPFKHNFEIYVLRISFSGRLAKQETKKQTTGQHGDQVWDEVFLEIKTLGPWWPNMDLVQKLGATSHSGPPSFSSAPKFPTSSGHWTSACQ